MIHIRLELVLESNPIAPTFTNNKGIHVRASIKVCEEPIYNSGDESIASIGINQGGDIHDFKDSRKNAHQPRSSNQAYKTRNDLMGSARNVTVRRVNLTSSKNKFSCHTRGKAVGVVLTAD